MSDVQPPSITKGIDQLGQGISSAARRSVTPVSDREIIVSGFFTGSPPPSPFYVFTPVGFDPWAPCRIVELAVLHDAATTITWRFYIDGVEVAHIDIGPSQRRGYATVPSVALTPGQVLTAAHDPQVSPGWSSVELQVRLRCDQPISGVLPLTWTDPGVIDPPGCGFYEDWSGYEVGTLPLMPDEASDWWKDPNGPDPGFYPPPEVGALGGIYTADTEWHKARRPMPDCVDGDTVRWVLSSNTVSYGSMIGFELADAFEANYNPPITGSPSGPSTYIINNDAGLGLGNYQTPLGNLPVIGPGGRPFAITIIFTAPTTWDVTYSTPGGSLSGSLPSGGPPEHVVVGVRNSSIGAVRLDAA